jgi:hypothetical protein
MIFCVRRLGIQRCSQVAAFIGEVVASPIPPLIVGNSLGGFTAMAVTSAFPELSSGTIGVA